MSNGETPESANAESNKDVENQSTPNPTPSDVASSDVAPSESAPSESVSEAATAAEPIESVTSATGESQPAAETDAKPTGPLSKLARGGGPLAARGLGVSKPASPAVDTAALGAGGKPQSGKPSGKPKKKNKPTGGKAESASDSTDATPEGGSKDAKPQVPSKSPRRARVALPNLRQGLSSDLQAELDAELLAADVDSMLTGSAGMAERAEPLAEGARVHAQVIKIHEDNVFVALGGPDEGVIPFVQFKEEPAVGSSVEVIVRGISGEDGLYALSLPGGAIEVNDWEDLEEGTVVDATVTGSNTGGLECKVGGVKGFIPISQISEYRVEDTSEFVGQKFLCVITEASERRGNLVLSRRAVHEREREEKRKEQLEKIEVGDLMEGTVRSLKDFGAFVDLGGLDGLIHISKLSWDRVKHPNEVLEEGQKVKVKIDRVDKETGKISLSYRDLLDNPWDTAEQDFGVGTMHTGTVSRIANFGCFVKLAAGVEGLVHISELAHHRVSKVDAFVSEGQSVEVKVLSFDRETQKIGLSIKAAQQPPVDETAKKDSEADVDEPPREPAVKSSRSGPLKGGNDRETGGERFGLRW
ncbi:MAG: S1 RNA-binding domain-containing protein [Planctomycetota bacterium]